jgi:hypothetical protein
LAALIKGKSQLKGLIASAHSISVLLKEPSLAVKENVKQNKTTMLDFPEAVGVVPFTSDYHATN